MKRSIIIIMLTAIATSALAVNEEDFSRKSFSFGTTTLPYRCAEIHNGEATPALVLYLHGGSSRGNDNEKQLNEAAVSTIYQYMVKHGISATFIVPQCPSNGGWTSQLRRVVNELLKSYIIAGTADSNRVYVLGGSMGGTGTWCQLSYFPNFYTAAMPVAGNPTGMNADNVATTPVYTVMGTADNIMSIDIVEEFQTQVLAAGGMLFLDVENGWTHQNTCEQSYTTQRLDWLFSQTRAKMPAIKGDLNGDGQVDVTDVSLLIDVVLGKIQQYCFIIILEWRILAKSVTFCDVFDSRLRNNS